MRVASVIVVSALVASISLLTLTPRLDHTFPSLVDDWYVIEHVPGQVTDALTLRIPEDQRYRPGWIVWSALQWHTLGAPNELTPPLVWWLIRVVVLAAGIVTAALVCAGRSPATLVGRVAELCLAGGAALVVVTVPGFAVDLARYGPQEPLMVGLMCGGGGVLAAAINRALRSDLTDGRLALWGALGALAFGVGVTQKETSICVLVLVPFLWSATGDTRLVLAQRPRRTRRTIWILLAAAALPLLPMTVRTVQLTLAPSRFYDATPGEGIFEKTQGLFDEMDTALGSHSPELLMVVAAALLVTLTLKRRIEMVAAGFLATSLAFLTFAGQVNVTPSRYYLPTVTLAALAVVRLASRLRSVRADALAAGLLLVLAMPQVWDARELVDTWVSGERQQERMVRVVGGLRAAGCDVRLAGREVELIQALPVLTRVADEEPTGCNGQRFVAVLNWHFGEDPNDATISSCGRTRDVVFRNDIGRVLACEP